MRTRMVTAVRMRHGQMKVPNQELGKVRAALGTAAPTVNLVLLFASLLAAALARQRFLHALFFARLEVKGMTLHFLNDVLLLDLALKTAQGVL